ncbi:glycolate oxidase subunit GlcD, partial [bacterium SM23_31]
MKNKALIKKLKKLLGKDRVITNPDELLVYESDALPVEKAIPWAVLFPHTTEEVSKIVKVLRAAGAPFVPRGSGTGLSGGCLPVGGGFVISLTRMTKILEIDIRNRYAVVEPGVITQWITDAVEADGYYFAPDPSSGLASTIGGNVAENAGGPHTMKYGVTVNHILGLELVLPDGEIVTVGGKTLETPGYDLVGVLTGSEGTFAIVTKVIVRLLHLPESYLTFYVVYDSVDDATRSVSGLLGAGIIPAALEMIDPVFIEALNEAFDMQFPEDAGAILIIELDGAEAGMEILKKRIIDVCNTFNVRSVEAASSSEERTRLWKARKLAFGAVGRLSPCYYTQDGVVPRTKLPDILRKIYEVGKKYNIRIANSFHAGDGNIHPCLMYDERVPGA